MMRGGRLRLIRIVAFILVLGLAIFSPLISSSGERAANVNMNVPHGIARVTEPASPRPEVRIERVLKLEEFKGFDPDLASLLGNSREQHPSYDAPMVEQLASLSPE